MNKEQRDLVIIFLVLFVLFLSALMFGWAVGEWLSGF